MADDMLIPEFKAPFKDWDKEDDWFNWPKPFVVLVSVLCMNWVSLKVY